MGKKIDVWSFEHSVSNHLREIIGEGNFHFIDVVLEEIMVSKRNGSLDGN